MTSDWRGQGESMISVDGNVAIWSDRTMLRLIADWLWLMFGLHTQLKPNNLYDNTVYSILIHPTDCCLNDNLLERQGHLLSCCCFKALPIQPAEWLLIQTLWIAPFVKPTHTLSLYGWCIIAFCINTSTSTLQWHAPIQQVRRTFTSSTSLHCSFK